MTFAGERKFHPASGERSSLVFRDSAEPTSYWVEEKPDRKSEITFFKNFATNGYLGQPRFTSSQFSLLFTQSFPLFPLMMPPSVHDLFS